MKTISIIGCGNVGKTLGKTLAIHKLLIIHEILNTTTVSSKKAIKFISQGKAAHSIKFLQPCDILFIATPDDAIASCVKLLIRSSAIKKRTIVFHACGSLSSKVLSPLKKKGAHIASIHPLKSFADPKRSVKTFKGTFCAVEGDKAALKILLPLFSKIGAHCFPIAPKQKLIYHAGGVFISNYLVALFEIALQCFEKSGLPRKEALAAVLPFINGTIANIASLGTVHALTGPIARGDHLLVSKQSKALQQWNREIGILYQELGKVALSLTTKRKTVSNQKLIKMNRALRTKNS